MPTWVRRWRGTMGASTAGARRRASSSPGRAAARGGSGHGADREQGAVVDRVHEPVAANDRRRVRLADAGGEHDLLRQRVGREVPAVEDPVLVVDERGMAGGVDGGGVDAPLAY